MSSIPARACLRGLALLTAFLLVDRLAGATPEPQINLASPDIALGSVAPEDSPDQPRFVQGVSIRSDQPWTLQLLASDLASTQTVSRLRAERLLWRLRGDRFRPLASDLPILLSTRPPTGPNPVTLFLEFAVRSDWSVSPGSYTGSLTFVLNTAGSPRPIYLPVAAPVRLIVDPLAVMRVLGATVDSPTVDPTRSDAYPYAPIRVAVRANTGWSLSAEPMDDFSHERAASRLPAGILSASVSAQEPKNLERGAANLLATGGPTGTSESIVVLQLKARLAGGEAAGRYRIPLRLRLATTGVASRS
ncbi:MAG: hypothetical protein ABI968_00190 [Acidobacteriota bacterium]